MTKVILDEALRSRLNNLDEHVVLCDEAGRAVAHCILDDAYQRMAYGWLKAQVSDEEVEVLRQQKGGRPLVEIWASLGQS